MGDAGGLPSGARRASRWVTVRAAGTETSVQTGVERGMVLALAVAAPLLVLLSLPDLTGISATGSSALEVVCLLLTGLLMVVAPVSLLRRGAPASGWLRLGVVVYVALLAIETVQPLDPMLEDSSPWLIGLSCIAFSCLAIGMRHPLHAGIGGSGILALLVWVHTERMPDGSLVVETGGLAALTAALVVGVRALRARARKADVAERQARELYESSRRLSATAAERVRTDALLHDTVLATLLAAAGQGPGDRTALMASSALDIVSDTTDRPDARPQPVTFEHAVAAAEQEIAPMVGLVQLDLDTARAVELPPPVAEALTSAMLQALNNSIRHAGPTTIRGATAVPLEAGGLRITITDDGYGFDTTQIGERQLGIRVSILERLRKVGACAAITSTPTQGTTVILEWQPTGTVLADHVDAVKPVELVSRKSLYGMLATVILIAILIAAVEAAFLFQALGPIIAAALGVMLLPALIRGARTGTMPTRTAWILATVGSAICFTGTIGLSPDEVDAVTISWYTCGVLAGCVMVWMAGHRLPPVVVIIILIAAVTTWAGPAAVIQLALAAEIVIAIAGLMMHGALRRVTESTRASAAAQRETLTWQVELDAFHQERQDRLRLARTNTEPMLRRIIHDNGDLDPESREECRILEQTLRDEIRGRRLLNDATRSAIYRHRQRGAVVQVLDDGGLDDLSPTALDGVLDQAAARLAPVRSNRIIIRTAPLDSDAAITIVASSPDETAAALGLDTNDEIELWLTLPRPTSLALAK